VRTTSAPRAAPAAAHREDAAKGADDLAPARAATVSVPANNDHLVEATADDDHGACPPRAAPNALAATDASAPPRGTARRTKEESILLFLLPRRTRGCALVSVFGNRLGLVSKRCFRRMVPSHSSMYRCKF
jgi:hypothetical protein